MALGNWEYFQIYQLAIIFHFFCQTFVVRPNNYFKQLLQADLPRKLPTNFRFWVFFLPQIHYFLLKQKKSVKFGEFWIVQACKDASVKNHPVESGEPFQKWSIGVQPLKR